MDLDTARIERFLADNTEQMVCDIRRLVSIRSVAGEATPAGVYGAGCAQTLRTMLELGHEYGFATQDHDGRCGSIFYPGTGEKTIGIWGHLDVVPEGDGWTWPPYDCQQTGDYLIGRGVQDNKGPVVAGLYAMRCIRELGLPVRCGIRQVVGCNEECGMDDVEYYLQRWKAPDFSLVIDSGFPVCHGEKGLLRVQLRSGKLGDALQALEGGSVPNVIPDSAYAVLSARQGAYLPGAEPYGESVRIEAQGICGHAAFPGSSVNAIGKLCTLLAGALQGYDARAIAFIGAIASSSYGEGLGIQGEDEVSGRLTCAGSVVRLEEGRAVLSVDIRYPVTASSRTILGQIGVACDAAGFEVKDVSDSPPSYVEKTHPCVQLLTRIYNEETGRQTVPFVMGGGTYARKISNAVAFGPGMDTDLSPLGLKAGHGAGHSPDEALYLPDLLLATKIYVRALLELGNVL